MPSSIRKCITFYNVKSRAPRFQVEWNQGCPCVTFVLLALLFFVFQLYPESGVFCLCKMVFSSYLRQVCSLIIHTKKNSSVTRSSNSLEIFHDNCLKLRIFKWSKASNSVIMFDVDFSGPIFATGYDIGLPKAIWEGRLSIWTLESFLWAKEWMVGWRRGCFRYAPSTVHYIHVDG